MGAKSGAGGGGEGKRGPVRGNSLASGPEAEELEGAQGGWTVDVEAEVGAGEREGVQLLVAPTRLGARIAS